MQTVRTSAHHKQLDYMNNPVIYSYKGSEISFMSGESTMINATQMAKPFNKRTNDWLSLKQTNELIDSLSAKTGIPATGLVTVNQGGNNQGTWLYEDLALIFAQWLSPDFYLWCNDRIKELLKTGVATVSNDDEAIAYAMQVLNRRLEESKAEKERLEQQNRLQSEQLKLAAPKVQYVDNVLRSVNTYTVTQLAKELGFTSGEALNKKLKEMRVQYKQSGQWLLYTDYSGKGYTKTKTESFTRNDGSIGTNTYTVWTEVGRAFLHSLFKVSC